MDRAKFLTSCLAIYQDDNSGIKIISCVVDYEFEELLKLITDFNGFEESEEIKLDTKVRLFLFTYCHVIEVNLIYLILYNMLNTLNGNDYSSIIKFITKKNEEKEATIPFKKIEIINNNAKKAHLDLELLFEEFFDNRLRNAFDHSEYYIDDSGELSITAHISPTSSRVGKTISGPKKYSFEDSKDKYDKRLQFLKSFINIYKKHVIEFQDGKSYPTIFGDVFFDSELGEWRAAKPSAS